MPSRQARRAAEEEIKKTSVSGTAAAQAAVAASAAEAAAVAALATTGEGEVTAGRGCGLVGGHQRAEGDGDRGGCCIMIFILDISAVHEIVDNSDGG